MTRPPRRLAAKHALITGGSAGIGAAIARRLVDRGSGVTLAARRPEALQETAAALRRAAPGARVRTLAVDVADETEVAAAVGPELDAQPIDLLVNCAGIAHSGRFTETDADAFRRQMEVNYFGTLWMVRIVVPRFLALGRGHVVNVGSMASLSGYYGYAAYAPAKFAVYGLTQVLRAELEPRGIRISILLPPNTETAQLAAELESAPPETRRFHASGPVLDPDDVAQALLRGLDRGRFEIVPGVSARVVARMGRVAPGLSRRFFDRLIARPGT